LSNIVQSAGFVVCKVTVVPPIPLPAAGSPVPTASQVPAATTPVPPTQVAPSLSSIVVSQEPAPGQKVVAGSAINFVVK
jgi:hypothetical protein